MAAITAMRSLPATRPEFLMASMRWSTKRTASSRASFSEGKQAREYSRPKMETSTLFMDVTPAARREGASEWNRSETAPGPRQTVDERNQPDWRRADDARSPVRPDTVRLHLAA